MKSALLLAGLCLMLAACAGERSKALGPPVSEINRLPLAEARPLIAGKTLVTYVDGYETCPFRQTGSYTYPICSVLPGPGSQVTYLAADGRAYLWHPGEKKILPGRWVLRAERDSHEVCVGYAPDSTGRAAVRAAGDLNCILLGDLALSVTETGKGDLFDLASGQAPYILGRDRTTLEKLSKGP